MKLYLFVHKAPSTVPCLGPRSTGNCGGHKPWRGHKL